jgi:protein-tyrosine phosphatase
LIDLHSHVLPGLDDGARDLDEALAICAAAAADGTRVLAATPHVRDDYPTTPGAIEEALDALRAAGPALDVVPGAELDLVELERSDDELELYALGGRGGRWLLVEMPYFGWPLDFADRLFRLRVRGFRAVLAHPERNRDVQGRPELLDPLVAGGTLVQLTAASVDGRFGSDARRCARELIDRGCAHLIASDAHTAELRTAGLSGAAAQLGDRRLAWWLTVEVPGAILDGSEPPPRPEPRPRRRLFR